jgi:molybdopterin-guanine dinucleotide biosynthesis protein A
LDTSGIILAGGRSLRLGHDKVLEKIDSQSLLERVISRIDPLCREIIIVTAQERALPQLDGHSKLKTVSDIYPGKGSLGGIYTGLVTSNSLYNLVIACDMPFLSQPLLSYMIEVSDGFDFVLPRLNNMFEPLHAVYSRKCIAPIETILNQGKRVIIELFKFVRVRYVETEEIDRFDPGHLSFFNINTQEDLELARKIARGDNP